MKNAVFVILLIVFVLTTFAACSASIPEQSAVGDPSAQKETAVPEVKVTPVPETEAPIVETEEPKKEEPTEIPHKAGEIELADNEIDIFQNRCRSTEPDTVTPLENVPVFFASDLLNSWSSMCPINFSVNGGACESDSYSIAQIITIFPSFTCRKCSESKYYIVFDTETGYRLFIYSREMSINAGFSVLIKHGATLLGYDDFKGLSIGDPIEKVCEVDPTTENYKEYFRLFSEATNPQKLFNEEKHPASIHYLSDGILEIDYEMTENGEIRIKNMIYSEDYKLPDKLGILLDYTICDIDLP